MEIIDILFIVSRAQTRYYTFCRWEGIGSDNLTNIVLLEKEIRDDIKRYIFKTWTAKGEML